LCPGEDLKGFKPNMYRLMQRSQTPLKIGLQYNHVFEQERNRVEFITDWPAGNEANIISSLQVGLLSRTPVLLTGLCKYALWMTTMHYFLEQIKIQHWRM